MTADVIALRQQTRICQERDRSDWAHQMAHILGQTRSFLVLPRAREDGAYVFLMCIGKRLRGCWRPVSIHIEVERAE